MPQRFLRPGLTTSDAWNACSFEAQSLYVRLITIVDDHGRYDGRVSVINGQCFALRPEITTERCGVLLLELSSKGLVTIYQSDGKPYIAMTKWNERTRGASKHPDPKKCLENIPQESAGIRRNPQEMSGDSCLLSLSPSHESLVISHKPTPSVEKGLCASDAQKEPASDLTRLNLIKGVLELYNRTGGLDYQEECLSIELARRPNILNEFETIRAYHAKMPADDRRYFPQSVKSLLNNFTATLDRVKANHATGTSKRATDNPRNNNANRGRAADYANIGI